MSELSQPLLEMVAVYHCVRLLADSRNLHLTGDCFLHGSLQSMDLQDTFSQSGHPDQWNKLLRRKRMNGAYFRINYVQGLPHNSRTPVQWCFQLISADFDDWFQFKLWWQKNRRKDRNRYRYIWSLPYLICIPLMVVLLNYFEIALFISIAWGLNRVNKKAC